MQAIKAHPINLKGKPVMLSASIPEDLVGSPRSQDCYTAVVVCVQHILAAGGRMIFGGHPTITPLVHYVAQDMVLDAGAIDLFQLRRFEKEAPQEIHDQQIFRSVNWVGDVSGQASLEEELGLMREEMVRAAQAGIFLGGKTKNYSGSRPGIRDEYERYLNRHPEGPVYLLGLLEGETANIINELESEGRKEPNGLSAKELEIVHHSDSIDLIAGLIVEDLDRFPLQSS